MFFLNSGWTEPNSVLLLAELHRTVHYKVNMVIMVWGKTEFQNKIGTAKSKNCVNRSSHFAYKVCLKIILLKIQFKFSFGELGKKPNTRSWPIISVVHLMTLIYFSLIVFKIL